MGDDICDEKVVCSFCGKGMPEVRHMIAGLTGSICGKCVGICNIIINGPRPAVAAEFGLREKWEILK